MRVDSSGAHPHKKHDSQVIFGNKRETKNSRIDKSSLEKIGTKKPHSLIYHKSESTNLSLSDKRAIRDMVKGFYKDSGKIISGDSILSAMNNRNGAKSENQNLQARDLKVGSVATKPLSPVDKRTIPQRAYPIESFKPHSDQDIPEYYSSRPSYESFRRYNPFRNSDSKQPTAAWSGRIGSGSIRSRRVDADNNSHLQVMGNPEKPVRIGSSIQTVASYPKTDAVELSLTSKQRIRVKRLHIPNQTHLPTRIETLFGSRSKSINLSIYEDQRPVSRWR